MLLASSCADPGVIDEWMDDTSAHRLFDDNHGPLLLLWSKYSISTVQCCGVLIKKKIKVIEIFKLLDENNIDNKYSFFI